MSNTLSYVAHITVTEEPKKALCDSDLRKLITEATALLNREIDEVRIVRGGGQSLKVIPLRKA